MATHSGEGKLWFQTPTAIVAELFQGSRNPGLQPPRIAGPRFNVRFMAAVARTVKESSPILALCRRLYAPWVCGDYGWSSFASTHPWGSPHASRLPATAAWSLKHGGGVNMASICLSPWPETYCWRSGLDVWSWVPAGPGRGPCPPAHKGLTGTSSGQ